MERCRAAARARGGVFVLDEFHMLAGERQHARYLHDLAAAVGMDDLAEQLDPDDFEPGPMERIRVDQIDPRRVQ